MGPEIAPKIYEQFMEMLKKEYDPNLVKGMCPTCAKQMLYQLSGRPFSSGMLLGRGQTRYPFSARSGRWSS